MTSEEQERLTDVETVLPVALPEPVPATTLPWSSTDATAAKFVLMPNTALNASA